VEQPLLELRQVSKNYKLEDSKQELEVLTNINFMVQRGEFVSIVGPSGCGKSTLLLIIAGLIAPNDGECLYKGEVVKKPSLERGLVFQEPRLLPWLTVKDNIGLAGEYDEGLLKKMDLEDFSHAFPHELSGGMASRVALARALAPRPDLLLLDEPLATLDQNLRSKLQGELQRIWKDEGVTCILVTHDLNEALALGTRLIVLGKRPGTILHDTSLQDSMEKEAMKEQVLTWMEG